SRKEFWEVLGRLKRQGITIVVSTPYMDEASLCDRIALIQQGKILSVDTPQRIVAAYPDQLYAVKATDMLRLVQILPAFRPPVNSYLFGEYIHVDALGIDGDALRGDLVRFLAAEGFKGIEVVPISPTIEDCFIKMLTS